MILKRDCKCGQPIEFEAEDLPGLNCPTCGTSLQEQFGTESDFPKRPRRESKTKPIEKWARSSALKNVRNDTCYPNLRGLINGVFWIGIGFCVLAVVASFLINSIRLALAQWGRGEWQEVIVAAIGALLGSIILGAIREALFVVLDIADVLIADRSDRLEAEARRNLETSPQVGI